MGSSRSHSFTTQSKMAEENEDFEIDSADAGAASEHNVEAGQIRKGGYIMKTGKHGHAKCKFSAVCIFTGNTCEELCPSTHSIGVPFVKKMDYQVMGLDGGYLQLMTEDGEMKEDLQLPNVTYKTDDDQKISEMLEDYCNQINEGAEIDVFCSVTSAIGQEKVTEVKKKDA